MRKPYLPWFKPRQRGNRLKRILDLGLTLPALIILSGPMLIISLIIRLTSRGPVLFRQPRLGFRATVFTLMKFRTMTEPRAADGKAVVDHASLTSETDEVRITSFGSFLRRTSLDELPELINVLKGEMSLVGPRPLLLPYWERYSPEQRRRNDVKPGLTGWAQINGRNALSWEARFKLDVWYVDHQSLWLDLKILMLTVWKILIQEGITHPNHATMEEFRG
jgi:sugar transferase EpsL